MCGHNDDGNFCNHYIHSNKGIYDPVSIDYWLDYQKSRPEEDLSSHLCNPLKRSNTSELLISVGKEKSTQGVRVLSKNQAANGDYYQKGVFSSIQPIKGHNYWFNKSDTDINHYDKE
jgi:hypothetical protein